MRQKPISLYENDKSIATPKSQKRFLIVCPLRSGSTWLELMLNALPDVEADYEIKWAPNMEHFEIPNRLHIYLTDASFDVGQEIFKALPDSEIAGSKLVLDDLDYSESSLADLRKTIPRNIKIIFIWRDPVDIILSIRRGVSNKLRSGVGSSVIESELKKEQYKYSNRHFDRDFFSFDRRDFLRQVHRLRRHHDWCQGLQNGAVGYLAVDYEDIANRFAEIARFIGSHANDATITQILKNPAIEKTGPKQAERNAYLKNQTDLGRLLYWSSCRRPAGALKLQLALAWYEHGDVYWSRGVRALKNTRPMSAEIVKAVARRAEQHHLRRISKVLNAISEVIKP